MTRTDLVGKRSAKILDDAVRRGAEDLVVACPMCHSNLDMRRPAIDAQLGASHATPVLFVTQVLGLAFGLPPERLGLQRHMVPVRFVAAHA